MKIVLEYQRFSEDTCRPYDCSMSTEAIESTNFLCIPNVGDYIKFSGDESGEQGLFKVRSKLFNYSLYENEWTLYLNIVVEEETDPDKYGELIKM